MSEWIFCRTHEEKSSPRSKSHGCRAELSRIEGSVCIADQAVSAVSEGEIHVLMSILDMRWTEGFAILLSAMTVIMST